MPRPRDTSRFSDGAAFTPDLHAPRDSWWLDVDRETFRARVSERLPSMRKSRFGLIQSAPTLGPNSARPVKPKWDLL